MLMKDFYQQLVCEGLTVRVALQKAMLQAIEKECDVVQWAGFVVHGLPGATLNNKPQDEDTMHILMEGLGSLVLPADTATELVRFPVHHACSTPASEGDSVSHTPRQRSAAGLEACSGHG